MILILAIPVYDDNNNITDVLAMGILASWLSDQIDDIVVGKTGECYILDNLGSTTIEKIGTAIQAVGVNAGTMEDVGAELVSNMTETAATVEEIVRTIKQLNNSIETQAASVAQSSSSVEEMVANIASIGQTLGKTELQKRCVNSTTLPASSPRV